MNLKKLNQSVKKYSLLSAIVVLFSLFMSYENVLAEDFNITIRDKVSFEAYRGDDGILFDAEVYDYSSGPNKHQYLQSCIIEFSVDNKNYTRLLDVKVPKQSKSANTEFQLLSKLRRAVIEFDSDVNVIGAIDPYWPANIKHVKGTVPTSNYGVAFIAFAWRLGFDHKNVRYIRISGTWVNQEKQRVEFFKRVVYDVRSAYVKKSKASGINEEVSVNNAINVFKESDEIVIKGADLGTNIKVCTTSGVEIKSFVSNTDIVKIKPSVKQVYVVHVGKSEYKIAL